MAACSWLEVQTNATGMARSAALRFTTHSAGHSFLPLRCMTPASSSPEPQCNYGQGSC